jgi:hypothetical protein
MRFRLALADEFGLGHAMVRAKANLASPSKSGELTLTEAVIFTSRRA